jgi:hypothetical protein
MRQPTRIEQFHEFAERPDIHHAASFEAWLARERAFERTYQERNSLWRGIRSAVLIGAPIWLLILWRVYR